MICNDDNGSARLLARSHYPEIIKVDDGASEDHNDGKIFAIMMTDLPDFSRLPTFFKPHLVLRLSTWWVGFFCVGHHGI